MVCLLSGCGFALRGHKLYCSVDQVALSQATTADRFGLQIQERFEAHGIDVRSGDWHLSLGALSIETQPLAYAPNGELARQSIRMDLPFVLTHQGERVLDTSASTMRQHAINPNTQLATQYEYEIITHEMKEDLISQLLIQVCRGADAYTYR